MDFPNLQPREWLEGYRGRFARLNQVDKRYLLASLREGLPQGHGQAKGDLAALVAQKIGISLAELVTRHSLWPMTTSMGRTGVVALNEMTDVQRRNLRVFFRERPLNWLCPECAREEAKRFYLSFWHTAHQVPGEYRCDLHGSALRGVLPSDLLKTMPHEHLARGDSKEHRLAAMTPHPRVDIAIALSRLLRVGDLTVRPQMCADAVLQRSAELGFEGDGRALVARVSDHVKQCLPRDWFEDVMSKSSTRQAVETVLGHYGKEPTRIVLSVVAASMFDSVPAALESIA